MLKETEVKNRLNETGALLSGHFRLSSGRHSSNYLQCAKVLQYPDKAEILGRALGKRCKDRYAALKTKIDAVASPAVGGMILGHEVARFLGVRAVFAERDEPTGKLTFRRGFTVERGECLLLVDDVLTTGGSLKELGELVESLGARVLGLAALAERGFHEKSFSVPRDVLLRLNFEDFEPDTCPACKKGVPVVKPGSRPGQT